MYEWGLGPPFYGGHFSFDAPPLLSTPSHRYIQLVVYALVAHNSHVTVSYTPAGHTGPTREPRSVSCRSYIPGIYIGQGSICHNIST